MAERFQKQGTQYATLRTGEAEEQADLADKLRAFSQRAGAMRRPIVAEVAREKGLQAGMGKTELEEGAEKTRATIAGRAFNEGLMASHLAAVQSDVRDTVNRLTIEADQEISTGVPGAVEKLNESLSAYRESMLSNVDERIAPAVLAEIDSRFNPAIEKAKAKHWEKTRQDSVAHLQNNYEGQFADLTAAARSNNPDDVQKFRQQIEGTLLAMEALGASTADTDKVREQVEKSIRAETIIGEAERTIGEGSPEELERGMEELEEVMASELPQEIKDEIYNRTMALAKDKEILFKSARATEIQEENFAREMRVAKLDVGIETGETTFSDINEAVYSRDMTPAEGAAMTKRLLNQHKGRQEIIESFAAFDNALRGGVPLDPSAPGVMKGAEKHFGMWMDTMGADLQTPEGRQLASSYIQATGVVPPQVQSHIAALQYSDNPDYVTASADMIGRMDNRFTQQISEDKRAYAELISTLTTNNVDPAEAIKMARDAVYNVSPEMREIRSKALKEIDILDYAKDSVGDLQSGLASFRSNTPTPQYQEEFAILFKNFYNMTGDEDAAYKLAERQINASWGYSDLSGQTQLMRNPPEKLYNDTSGFVKKQFQAESGEGEILVSDEVTGRTKTYAVMYNAGSEGAPLMLPVNGSDGRPKRWAPDIKKEQDKINEKRKKQIEAAQREREMERRKMENIRGEINLSKLGIDR